MEEKRAIKKDSCNYVIIILSVILVITSLSNLIYNLFFNDVINQLYLIINSTLLFLTTLVYSISSCIRKVKPRDIMTTISIIMVMIFTLFNLLVATNLIKIKEKASLPDFTNKNINELTIWAQKNNIEFLEEYVYSDDYEENIIVSQNITPGTLLKLVKDLKVVVSKGPNYNESVVVPVMIDWNIDDVVKFIEENHLINVTIEYELNEEISKDTLIRQSTSGAITRRDALTLTFSLGRKEDLVAQEMADLKNKSLFNASLWLKQNGINYQITYAFSDTVKRGNVISTDKAVGEVITPFETLVNVVVSKGKEIKVPDLVSMSNEEIVKWLLENNLKIEFLEAYHDSIAKGKIISANYKKDDVIEEETNIQITLSKGTLILEKFNTLNELRNWANKYEIKLEEIFEFNNSVASGSIIKVNPEFGSSITPDTVINVTVSNGSGISIPNFVGKNRTYITSQCSKLGLRCSFVSGGYNSNVALNVATNQNKKAGTTVIKGTSIVITLSKGTPSTYKFVIQDSWFNSSITSYEAGVNMLKNKFATYAKDAKFTFVRKTCESLRPGYIHPSSPIKGGTSLTVTAGNTYQVWLCG